MSIDVDQATTRDPDGDGLQAPLRAIAPRASALEAQAQRRIEAALFGDAPMPTLGRYQLLRCIGTGGMGSVWAAFDPELRRDVAIKLVLADRLDPSAITGARFVREMRALGRVNHPNVLALFDCGSYDVDPVTGAARAGVYMVTELVEGTRLDQWVQRTRDASAVLDVLMALGEGLAAAHDAGLVHRDIKPANAIVGDDGRARLLDFGLARAPDPADTGERGSLSDAGSLGTDDTQPLVRSNDAAMSAASSTQGSGGGDRLTAHDRVLGTPHYMAPEQAIGGALDARTDQWSFCLVAAEALLDEPLFVARWPEGRAAAKLAGPPPRPPRSFAASTRVWAVLARGLAPDPAGRWPSVRALLRALQRARRPRLLPVLALGVATLGGVAGAVALARAPAPACALPEDLADVWGPQVGTEIRAALPASTRDAWDRSALQLDAFARAWQQARVESCRAPVIAASVRCLGRARDGLAAVVEALRESPSEPDAIDRAIAGLAAPQSCVGAGDDDTPHFASDDPAQVEAVHRAERRAEALLDLGRPQQAVAATEAVALAAVGASPRLQGYAWGRIGAVLRLVPEVERAREAFERGYFLAMQQDAHDLAFKAAAELSRHHADALHDLEQAQLWFGHAEAALARIPEPDAMQRARLLGLRASLAHARFDYHGEYDALASEIEVLQEDPATSTETLVLARAELARAAIFLGRHAEAIALLRPAAESLARIEGEDAPRVQIVRLHLGDALVKSGRVAEGLGVLEHIASSGAPDAITTIYGAIGATEARWMLEHDAEAALSGYRSVLARIAALPRFSAREVALLHHRIGLVLADAGRHAEAESEQAIAITGIEAIAGAESVLLRQPLQALAAAQRAQGHGELAQHSEARLERLPRE
ncbi:MAG: protein kinase [Nannocystaceae bacterium]|nr:protein kinase [Nannocystaceae bacterium]